MTDVHAEQVCRPYSMQWIAAETKQILKNGEAKNYDRCPTISSALENALHRVRRWNDHPEECQDDILDYLSWQMKTIAEEMKWYFEYDGLAIAIEEMLPTYPDDDCHIVDANGSDATVAMRAMLHRGRFD